MIKAFNDGEDIHSATAREVFGISKNEKVPDNLRSAAKSINFGIVYGMSPFGLSKQLSISFAQAKEYIDGYFLRYSGVKKWMSKVVEDAKNEGFVRTVTGRIRYMPELRSSNGQVRAAGERMAMNTPIQGTSADIIKIAMINIYNELKKDESAYEAVMLCKSMTISYLKFQKTKQKTCKMIKYKMENAINLNVPLIVDVKTGKTGNDG